MKDEQIKIGQAIDLAIDALMEDGGHHKQWYLEEILKVLGQDVEELREEYDFEKGIAP